MYIIPESLKFSHWPSKSVLPLPSFLPPSVHPLYVLSLDPDFFTFFTSPSWILGKFLYFPPVPPVWAPPQAQAPSILQGYTLTLGVESLSGNSQLVDGEKKMKSQRVCKEKKYLTHWKINMEHNSGGLEDDFPFQLGDFM